MKIPPRTMSRTIERSYFSSTRENVTGKFSLQTKRFSLYKKNLTVKTIGFMVIALGEAAENIQTV